jgi:hypothetical protein
MRRSVSVAVAGLLTAMVPGLLLGAEEAKEPTVTRETDGDVEIIKVVGDDGVSLHMSRTVTATSGKGTKPGQTVTKTVRGKNSSVSVSISGFGGVITPVKAGNQAARTKLRSYYGKVAGLKDGTLVLNVEKRTDAGKEVDARKLTCAEDVAVLAFKNQGAVEKSLKDVKAGQNVVVTVQEQDQGAVVTRILIR